MSPGRELEHGTPIGIEVEGVAGVDGEPIAVLVGVVSCGSGRDHELPAHGGGRAGISTRRPGERESQ
jgi:hypothetical protein